MKNQSRKGKVTPKSQSKGIKKPPTKKKPARSNRIKKPSDKTLRVYNQLIKRGIPVIINEDGGLVFDLTKVNVSVKYTKTGKKYATFELREDGAEDITGNYETLMAKLEEIYSYIQKYEIYYLEQNPELTPIIMDEEIGVTTEMHQHLVTMNFGIRMPILFLKKYAFLIQAFENGKVKYQD